MILFSIETANVSLRFHLASTRKRLKTITFENGLQREQYENDTKTTCRCKTIVAFSSKMILFSIKTANVSLRFHLASTRKRLKTITFENGLQREQYENDTKTMCRCNTSVAFSLKTYSCRWPLVKIRPFLLVLLRRQAFSEKRLFLISLRCTVRET